MSVIKRTSGFTIVELLIVIVVIGILAAITVVSFNGVTAKTRDTIRVNDMKSIQKAVELYYVDNGTYPLPPNGSTNWSGNCATFGSSTTYIAGISNYLSKLPLDPRWTTADSNKCYLYKSTGTDYMAITWNAMETICGGDPSAACNSEQIRAMDRQSTTEPSIAIFSPGARLW